MAKKCIGCGAVLQHDFASSAGYVEKYYLDDSEYCRRCFRVKNYGEYEVIVKDNDEYLQVLRTIDATNDLVLYVVDLFNLDQDLLEIVKNFHNRCVLVLTKKDLFSFKIKDQKLINYFDNNREDFLDIVVVSAKNNYNLDILYDVIMKYKTSNNVFVVGNTNAGKSSLINAILKNYAHKDASVTTSSLPNTTLDILNVEISSELKLSDTPGLLVNTNMIQHVSPKVIKEILPKKEIKPITYQIKDYNTFILHNFARIESDNRKNSFTFYYANGLKLLRVKQSDTRLTNLKKVTLNLSSNEDIVIEGLCFIKVVNACTVNIYVAEEIGVYQRKNLI